MTANRHPDLKISVIIPIYNVEKYLARCIDSVIEQTYTNLEIILVDDGSPDNCGKICDEYAEKDNRIKVIHKKNGGLSSARNAGIEAAGGDLIGFVDSDDYIENNMYEKLILALLQSDADISICSYKCIDENGKRLKEKNFSHLKNQVLSKNEILNNLTLNNTGVYVIAVNRLYKKFILDKIKFPEGKLHEDEFTAHLFYYECNRVAIIPDDLYVYVKREGSITKSEVSIKKLDGIYAYLERYSFYKQKNLPNGKAFIISAYELLVYIFNNINVKKYRKEIFPVYKIILKHLLKEKNLRALKLILVYLTNRLK